MPGRRRGSPPTQKRVKLTSSTNKKRDAVILFADVVGCSEISNHLELEDYSDFIKVFQDIFNIVCSRFIKKVYDESNDKFIEFKTRGDEGCLKIYAADTAEQLAEDIDTAIYIALDLKRMWLMTEYNRTRTRQGLLPADIAIGIHSGKVFVDNEPEGYAINLAKRIESAAREGKYTHILLSESAYGQLDHLNYEMNYRFDKPSIKETKGISHTIKSVEIKHFHLSTDWEETFYEKPEETSLLFKIYKPNEISRAFERAYQINPTNLWLAEEYIYTMTLLAGHKLRNEDKEKNALARKRAYAPVSIIARRIAQSDLRDATLLSIWGQILGLMYDFANEEKKYKDAIDLDNTFGNFYWYRGLCVSYQLEAAYTKNKTELKKFYSDKDNQVLIKKVLDNYKLGMELNPKNLDIVYDFACELSWWSQVDRQYKSEAIKKIDFLLENVRDVKRWIKREDYFKPIIHKDPVKQWLS